MTIGTSMQYSQNEAGPDKRHPGDHRQMFDRYLAARAYAMLFLEKMTKSLRPVWAK